MNTNVPEVRTASGGIVAPINAPVGPAAPSEPVVFTASAREGIAAAVSYVLAYLYTSLWPSETQLEMKVLLALFTLGFFVLGESLYRERSRPRESWVWLGCALANLAALLADRGRVWGGSMFPFLHIFAVWWVLSRSGTLLLGESGRLLPLDALDGFLVFPFRHFFLRLRTVGFFLLRLRSEKKRERSEPAAVIRTVAAVVAALGLLVLAASLLSDADSGFAALFSWAAELLRLPWDLDLSGFLIRFLPSLPVGAYVYGLLAGAGREDREALRSRPAAVSEALEALRGVSSKLWVLLLALFCALYLVFFAVQGRYLFGAFTRTLPEGFVVAEYARQGFFELCKVMTVNFALLWLVLRSSKEPAQSRRGTLLVLCLILLAESLLLAVVAFSKLALYISCFGFTPRRLQSTWLVCVLAFGCICAGWSLLRNAKTFRVWMIFGAVTLSVLCLY